MKRIALLLAFVAAFGSVSFTAQEVHACKLLKLLFAHHRHDKCPKCDYHRCRCHRIHRVPPAYYPPAPPIYQAPLVVPAPELIQREPVDYRQLQTWRSRSRGRSF